jgi:hypothetical protein
MQHVKVHPPDGDFTTVRSLPQRLVQIDSLRFLLLNSNSLVFNFLVWDCTIAINKGKFHRRTGHEGPEGE